MPLKRDRHPILQRLCRALLAAAGTLAACGCAGEGLLERPSFVLITIDTLRADHLGCYGYFRNTSPNIDALARECVVFDHAYAPIATTLPSHASMLTARYPLEHGILANVTHGGRPFGWSRDVLSFAEVAKDAGYATAGFVGARPLKRLTGIAAGFEVWSEPSGGERRAGETLEQVRQWLDGPAREPFFLWVHFYDPHWPHRAPPPYHRMFGSDGHDPKLEAWLAERKIGASSARADKRSTTETRAAIDGYCGEVRYTDSQVGLLLGALREKGFLERSILVLTSDHGEGLNQHDVAAHGLVWDEHLRVPLLIRFPEASGVAPRRVGELVSLVDLFPTLLGRVEPLETAKWSQFLALSSGVDALAQHHRDRPIFGQRTERELTEDPGAMFALTTREWKYVHQPGGEDRLFDRLRDPHELENRIAQEAATAERLRGITAVWREEQERRGAALEPAKEPVLDEGELEANREELRELGYLEEDGG